MKKDLSAMCLHLVVGIIIGYFSFWMGSSVYPLVIAFLVGFALKKASFKLFPGTDQGWWFANGAMIYLFAWLITWIVLFNL